MAELSGLNLVFVEAWRRLPRPARHAAHTVFQAGWKALTPWIVSLRWRRGRLGGSPVLVAGFLNASTGIGAGARLFLDALKQAGVPAAGLDASRWVRVSSDLEAAYGDRGAGGAQTLVSHLNPPELEIMLRVSSASMTRHVRHIGYWAWELPCAPPSWRRGFEFVDEVWTPSEFSAAALRALAPPQVPVRVVRHPVCAFTAATADRESFGLPADACLTLAAFDLKSTTARKNPHGALDAYRIAVPTPTAGSALVCKVSGAANEPRLFQALREDVTSRPDILLIDDAFSQARMSALIASVDIVLSPHRAEGFGLVLAEAMRLGKAVIATGWSGNMDYMDDTCAALIRYTLVPTQDPQGMYAGGAWAEPDITHAAELLSSLVIDADARTALGARASERISRQFDPVLWSAEIIRLLTGSSRDALKPANS